MQKIGTVVKRTKSFYYIDVGKVKPLLCKALGSFFNVTPQQERIAVGDEVEIEKTPANNMGIIRRLIPRRTKFSRNNNGTEQVLASNVDTLLMVASLKNPPFRGGLVDRVLVAGSSGGLEPFLILSKADLVTSEETRQINDLYTSLGYTVIITSIFESKSLDKLSNLIQNRSSVLSGHSGVGKSSLISAIFPKWEVRIGKINEKSGRGKHTTVMAEMFSLPKGGFIIDSPGIRTFEPAVSKQELDLHFLEFSPLLGQCRFKECTHRHEPKCKIKEAVLLKKISAQRYKSYCSLFDSL